MKEYKLKLLNVFIYSEKIIHPFHDNYHIWLFIEIKGEKMIYK
jgi:hypothetical protein